MTLVQTVNYFLASLTIIGLVASGLIIVALILSKSNLFTTFLSFLSNNVIYLTLLVSTTALFGSLFYSEIAKYNPCTLCWYQRILIYPQVFLLWFALVIKDKSIVKYILLLSALCVPLSLYHYLIQFGVVTIKTCSVVGYSASCSESFGATFGFITIPFMAFITVLLNTLLSLNYLKNSKRL